MDSACSTCGFDARRCACSRCVTGPETMRLSPSQWRDLRESMGKPHAESAVIEPARPMNRQQRRDKARKGKR